MEGFFAVSPCFCSSAICCRAYPWISQNQAREGGWNHSWHPCAKLTSLWMGLAERIGDLPAFPAVAGSVLSDSDGKEYNSEAEL